MNRLLYILLIFAILLLTGCSIIASPTTTTTTVPPATTYTLKLDGPEAIAIAKQHAINSPDTDFERRLGLLAQKYELDSVFTPTASPSRPWNAAYMGSYKWDVFWYNFHWTVFDNNKDVIFIGEK
jgi:hypothetical protein